MQLFNASSCLAFVWFHTVSFFVQECSDDTKVLLQDLLISSVSLAIDDTKVLLQDLLISSVTSAIGPLQMKLGLKNKAPRRTIRLSMAPTNHLGILR